MAATLQETTHPRTPFLVIYTDPTKREKSGRAKRIPKHFSDRDEAEAYLIKINKQLQVVGTSGMVIFDHELKADALSARQILDALGVPFTLTEIVRDFVKRTPTTTNASLPIDPLLTEFLNEKEHDENCSTFTHNNYKFRLIRWFNDAGITTVSHITAETAAQLKKRHAVGARNRKNDMTAASVFCNWLKDVKKVIPLNPLAGMKRPTMDDKRPIAWSPEEARRVLKAAEFYRDGALASTVAIRIFAGLRPSEFVASRVVDNVIRVEGGKLRGRANRIVNMQPVLQKWLARYPLPADSTIPKITVRAWHGLHRLANQYGDQPIAWVPDIARHTFISYRIAIFNDEEAKQNGEAIVARESGNSPDIIYKHYFHLKTAEQAKRFWSIPPTKTARKTKLKKPANIQSSATPNNG